ncbi:MAG: 6-pyruvoyl tetrahydropterin synthase family protein [Bacteroidota bacterium]|nr:6-pyruvoyl tetrahydropterin synthase family protein [Candidatus Kapabacteria bacterium]MDW8220526.1 6-pyruvoyl tetrahydropterin synthase family protein [Bacteroidota bacterium]
MTTRIAKEFRWEMAHRLPFHTAGCQNIHGHSYKLWVELEGTPDYRGMVMDYIDLKAVVEPIIRQLDHSFLCDRSDELMVQFFRTNTLKVNYVDFPTTAENIAQYLLREIAFRLRESQSVAVRRIRVRVQETERTYAEVALDF